MSQNIAIEEQIVRFSDTDAAGIVYFATFAAYFDESFISAMRKQGIGWDEHHEFNFLLPIVEQNIKFNYPLRAGDHFKVAMGIVKLSNRSFKTEHIVYLEDTERNEFTPVAEGFIARVVVDYNEFKPIPIPEPLISALRQYHVDEDNWKHFRQRIYS